MGRGRRSRGPAWCWLWAASSLQLLLLLASTKSGVGGDGGGALAAAAAEADACPSWHYNVEVNNLLDWKLVPAACESYVQAYLNSSAYSDDSQAAAAQASAFARQYAAHSISSSSSAAANFSYNAWVFDVDETSLSNIPFYALHHFGTATFSYLDYLEWMNKAEAPALPATLALVQELQELGFSIFFLTGRAEFQRRATTRNLEAQGYQHWDGLILRGIHELFQSAVVYKSAKRKALEDLGYTIVGNVGDQWSDLTGYSVGLRTFKLPNPLYYVP